MFLPEFPIILQRGCQGQIVRWASELNQQPVVIGWLRYVALNHVIAWFRSKIAIVDLRRELRAEVGRDQKRRADPWHEAR